MPDYTPKLNLPKPLGNENFNRANYNNLIDAIDGKAGTPDGLATLDASGKVPASQLNVSAPPDATTSTKGVVQLSNSTTSTSEALAATPKAVKDAKDGLSNQIGILSDSVVPYGTASGTNAKTISITDGFATLKTGLALSFKNTTANTGAVTLDVNGLGAKPVVKSGGTALASGNLKAGGVYTVRYDGTSFILQGEGGSGNALASDLLSGKTASTDAGDIVGTMINNGVASIVPQSSDVSITGFYQSGSVVKGAALVAPGDLLLISNATERGTGSQTLTKMKETKALSGGQFRIKFDLKQQSGYTGPAYGQIYVNGVPKGILRQTTSASPVTFTEDISVDVDDLVQLYCRTGGIGWAYVSNLNIYSNVGFTNILV